MFLQHHQGKLIARESTLKLNDFLASKMIKKRQGAAAIVD